MTLDMPEWLTSPLSAIHSVMPESLSGVLSHSRLCLLTGSELRVQVEWQPDYFSGIFFGSSVDSQSRSSASSSKYCDAALMR